MSKNKDKYIVITWYIEDGGDYSSDTFETSFSFVKESELDDIGKLMKYHGIKRWVKNPELVTEKTWKDGDGCLVEYRGLVVKPIKIVESWGWKRGTLNE